MWGRLKNTNMQYVDNFNIYIYIYTTKIIQNAFTAVEYIIIIDLEFVLIQHNT